jgi:zinc protease
MANGRTSRLYRTLIHDRRRAAELGAAQGSRELGSLFQVVATAAPDVSLEELRQSIVDEVTRIATVGPSLEELERSRVQAESAFVSRLQTLGGFGGKADQLNAYNVYTGSPSFFADDLQRYLRLTPADIQQAAARWLDADTATMLSVVPTGQLGLALPNSIPATVTT